MYNRRVKFGLKIPNHLGKNVRKFQGRIFFTHTVNVRRQALYDSNLRLLFPAYFIPVTLNIDLLTPKSDGFISVKNATML